jgi:hypothetical protein
MPTLKDSRSDCNSPHDGLPVGHGTIDMRAGEDALISADVASPPTNPFLKCQSLLAGKQRSSTGCEPPFARCGTQLAAMRDRIPRRLTIPQGDGELLKPQRYASR